MTKKLKAIIRRWIIKKLGFPEDVDSILQRHSQAKSKTGRTTILPLGTFKGKIAFTNAILDLEFDTEQEKQAFCSGFGVALGEPSQFVTNIQPIETEPASFKSKRTLH